MTRVNIALVKHEMNFGIVRRNSILIYQLTGNKLTGYFTELMELVR